MLVAAAQPRSPADQLRKARRRDASHSRLARSERGVEGGYGLEGVVDCWLNLSSSVPAAATHAWVDSLSAHLMKTDVSPRRMWKMAALL